MVKNYTYKCKFAIKAIKIIIIIIVYSIIFKNNILYAQSLEMSYEEAFINLQQLTHDILIKIINDEKFKHYLINKFPWFINIDQLLINEQIVNNFMKTISWSDIIEKINVTGEYPFSDMIIKFKDFCENLVKERYYAYLQERSQSYVNAFKDCNYIIEKTIDIIKNNLSSCVWIGACVFLYQMYYDPSNLEPIFWAIYDYALDPSKPHLQRLIEYLPQLAPYLSKDNSLLEINGIADHILTSNAKIAFENTVKTAVENKNTNIFIIVGIISVSLCVAGFRYCM